VLLQSGIHYLANLQAHSLPTQGIRNISIEANSILQKVWKAKSIPPFLKTFAWCLIRRALATAERAGRYSTHIDQNCTLCGEIDNDVHLFFLCDLPMQVWTSSTSPYQFIFLILMRMVYNLLYHSSFPLAPLKPPFLNSSLPHGIFEKHIMIIISRGEIRHPFRFSGQQRLTGKLIF
jgi:hypothetical protein